MVAVAASALEAPPDACGRLLAIGGQKFVFRFRFMFIYFPFLFESSNSEALDFFPTSGQLFLIFPKQTLALNGVLTWFIRWCGVRQPCPSPQAGLGCSLTK